MYKKIVRFSQCAIWPVSFLYFNSRYRLKIVGRENFDKVRSPFIIVSNHVSSVDSFMLCLILGAFSSPHWPLRFMGVTEFRDPWMNFLYDIGFIKLAYYFFGVFIIVKGRGLTKNLEEAKLIVREGGSVVIYAEGSIVKVDTVLPFKPGASVLALETGVPVMPMSFRLGKKHWLRKELTVNVGEPIKFDQKISPDYAARIATTKVLYETVAKLYQKP